MANDWLALVGSKLAFVGLSSSDDDYNDYMNCCEIVEKNEQNRMNCWWWSTEDHATIQLPSYYSDER